MDFACCLLLGARATISQAITSTSSYFSWSNSISANVSSSSKSRTSSGLQMHSHRRIRSRSINSALSWPKIAFRHLDVFKTTPQSRIMHGSQYALKLVHYTLPSGNGHKLKLARIQICEQPAHQAEDCPDMSPTNPCPNNNRDIPRSENFWPLTS